MLKDIKVVCEDIHKKGDSESQMPSMDLSIWDTLFLINLVAEGLSAGAD